jgi:hypothetical protein
MEVSSACLTRRHYVLEAEWVMNAYNAFGSTNVMIKLHYGHRPKGITFIFIYHRTLVALVEFGFKLPKTNQCLLVLKEM